MGSHDDGAEFGAELQRALGHEFADITLLRQALIHRSFTAEQNEPHSNERLEFLGDSVLQMAVTDYLYTTHPGLDEGQMSQIRHAIVSEPVLAAKAEELGLDGEILLGKGEEATGGRTKPSILSDAMEAVLGAVYLDAGYEEAKAVILAHWLPAITERARRPGARDYKSRLQERLARKGLVPEYRAREEGPDHEKVFTSIVLIRGKEAGKGSGTSKKRAEQRAAREALADLE